jgi:hypothetical protein
VISFRQLPHKLSATNRKKWIWIGLAAVPAIRLYYVQEMIAALIIFSALFSVLFVGAATAVLIIFLLDRASQLITAWAEPGVARVIRWVVDAVEGIIARPVWAHAVPHRFRKEQLKENEKN